MNLYQQFLALPIDRSCLGLEPRDQDCAHFCTPRYANILGWAGVDGVHYCTIPPLGSTIFCVSPMDGPFYVHPIARNFGDLLSLLLACGSMDAIAQAYMMDDARFADFVRNNPPLSEQQAAFDIIRDTLHIRPTEDPYAYISELQNGFDYASIPYTAEYYDTTGETPPKPWAVYFGHSFGCSGEGTPGEEIPVGKTFQWGEQLWHIPSVYRFEEGLMIDFCVEVKPEKVKSFIDKWDLLHEHKHKYTRAQQAQIEREHPLSCDFSAKLLLNGTEIPYRSGCGQVWLSPDCLGDAFPINTDSLSILEHYGLDPGRCWSLQRTTFPHAGLSDLHGLTVHLERRPAELPAGTIDTPKPDSLHHFTHPLSGKTYTLTVCEAEQQTLTAEHFRDPELEYPAHYTAMTYTISPDDLKTFRLQDAGQGDPVRRKNGKSSGAASIGIIGGASSPVLMLRRSKDEPQLRTAASALRFEPKSDICWQFSFYEKLMDDVEIELL